VLVGGCPRIIKGLKMPFKKYLVNQEEKTEEFY